MPYAPAPEDPGQAQYAMIDVTTLAVQASLLLGASSPFYDFVANYGPIVLMLVVAYVMLIRPGQNQENERKTRLSSLKKNDEVVLESGIVGRISSMEDTIAVVEIADRVKVRVLRSKILDTREHVMAQEQKTAAAVAPAAGTPANAISASGTDASASAKGAGDDSGGDKADSGKKKKG